MEEIRQIGRFGVSIGAGGVLLVQTDTSSLTLSPAEALELFNFIAANKDTLTEMLQTNRCAFCSTQTEQLYICIECSKTVCMACSESAPPTPNTPLDSERICRDCVDV